MYSDFGAVRTTQLLVPIVDTVVNDSYYAGKSKKKA